MIKRISSIFIFILLFLIQINADNYLLNGSFEYGLHTAWKYKVENNSRAEFILNKSSNVMDGLVELQVDVKSVSKTNTNSVQASTSFIAGEDSIYLLRFWARGPEESKVFVEIDGSETNDVLYEMHAGKTLFYLPFKIAPEYINKQVSINFYFQDDRTKTKINNSSECRVNTTTGAIYYLDGVEVLDINNKQNIDVLKTYNWNNKLPTTSKGWVTGDNDISLSLPDGRTIWFFNDSFYATANPNLNRLHDFGTFIRNAVVVEDQDGHMTTYPVVNQGGQNVYFKIPDDKLIKEGNSVKNFFWVGDAIMEDNIVKVHLIECVEFSGGVRDAFKPCLALFSYPELNYLGLEEQADFAATYETFFVDNDSIYLYRSENQSTLQVARTFLGNLSGNLESWEFWTGQEWTREQPIRKNHISRYYDVTKLGENNYAQVILHGYTYDVKVSFAEKPQGPWTAPITVFTASKDAAAKYYMPNFHGQLPNGNYSISYSANFDYCLFFCRNCDDWAFVDKYWYKPRYIQIDLLALSPYSPKFDCSRVIDGDAFIDECGDCVGGTTNKEPCITGIAIFYDNSSDGKSVGLGLGEYDFATLDLLGFYDINVFSLEVNNGYIVEVFDSENFDGNSTVLNKPSENLLTEDIKSLIIRRDGSKNLSGTYFIQNKQSRLFMTVQNESKNNHVSIIQSEQAGNEYQLFDIEHLANGFYKIRNIGSNLPIGIVDFSMDSYAKVEQWDGLNYLDITTFDGGVVSAQYEASSSSEEIRNLIDQNIATKYRTAHNKVWVQFESSKPEVVSQYSLISANNAPISDPKNWSLVASNDGENWVLLDTISGFKFSSRSEEVSFPIKNDKAYKFYRLNMEAYAGNALHLAEWSLFTGEQADRDLTNQMFVIQETDDGFVRFYNKASDLALEILDGIYEKEAPIYQVDDIGQLGVLWKLINPQDLPNHEPNIQEYENTSLNIFPNPIDDILNLDIDVNIDWMDGRLHIYDINGVLVHTSKLETSGINVSSLPAGYYFVKLFGLKQTKIGRFIKN